MSAGLPGATREDATRLRRPVCVRARTGRTFGGLVAANLPVRRSGSEGGKELGYDG
jgi:hypothetical protein